MENAKTKKAVIAMSGGVDSSAAAFIMSKNGYQCIGVTMRLYGNDTAGMPKGHTCCSLDDVEDARSVAFKVGIPFYVFDFTEDFEEKVIKRFACAYENGETPNPCIDCNRYMKFERLLKRAEDIGYDYVATGHYARIEQKNGRFLLKKAVDLNKDQSYVLYPLTQKQLSRTVFPLGGLKKSDTRQIAQEQGFLNAHKRESQDICFAPDGNYAAAIKRYTKKEYPQGNFVDKNGNVLGKHNGIICYTIGQGKGLGLSLPQRLYVVEKNTKNNTIVLGKNSDLYSKEIDVSGINWIAFETAPEKIRAKCRLRSRQTEQWCTVFITGKDDAHVVFDEPQRAPAKGQAAVFYDGEYVLGGGTIC